MAKKEKENELIFAPLKVKKIMQDNKDIGKVANMTPYVVSKSLEYFLKDLLNTAISCAKEEKISTLHPYHIKEAINKNENYSFLKEEVESVEDKLILKKKRVLLNNNKSESYQNEKDKKIKSQKSNDEDDEEYDDDNDDISY